MGWEQSLQDRLESNIKEFSKVYPRVHSSVLVPIGFNERTGREELVLTKRTMKVQSHKGQISFPGGYRNREDKDLLQTALRECYEEVGLDSNDVHIVGMLEPVRTIREVLITPWVGVIKLPYPFTLNPNEVERLIYLPLRRLMDEGLSPMEIKEGDLAIKNQGIVVGEDLIWGATARMLEQLRNHFEGLDLE